MYISKENTQKEIKVSEVVGVIENCIKEVDTDHKPKNVLFFGNFCGRGHNPVQKWVDQQIKADKVKVYIIATGLSPLYDIDSNGQYVKTDIYTFTDDMMKIIQGKEVLYIKYFGSSNEEFYRELYSILRDRKYTINIQGGHKYDLKNIKLVVCDEMEEQEFPDYVLELFDIYEVLDD